MKLKWHIGFILFSLGIGLLWIYSSKRAELILEFDQPVRLQVAEHSAYTSSRFVTVIPITREGIPSLSLSLETAGSRLRKIAVANRGEKVLIEPDFPARTGTWRWNLTDSQWHDTANPESSRPGKVIVEFHNLPATLLPKPTEDFLLATLLSFLSLEIARWLLLVLRARFNRLVFH